MAEPDPERAAPDLGSVDPRAPVLKLGTPGEPGALKGGVGIQAACRGSRAGKARSPFSLGAGKTSRAPTAAAET